MHQVSSILQESRSCFCEGRDARLAVADAVASAANPRSTAWTSRTLEGARLEQSLLASRAMTGSQGAEQGSDQAETPEPHALILIFQRRRAVWPVSMRLPGPRTIGVWRSLWDDQLAATWSREYQPS
ncbi:hypothetical protein VTN02DRAFT_4794 [Thermoascus thermophilus]